MAAGRIKGITIEIGGDTTKLVQALAKVDNALGKTKTNLRDIEKALKLDPTNTALLKDKQEELAKAIDLSKTRLEEEKKAYQELSKADKTPENVEKMRLLKEQIDLDTVALKDLEIRGAGNILGAEQHGHMDKIGYELYAKLLKDEVSGRDEKICETDIRTDAFIPDGYIESSWARMSICSTRLR